MGRKSNLLKLLKNYRLMRMSENMAMDMDSGELHFTSNWSDEEDD